MALDVTALRASFELVIDREPQLTRRFYENLFERYPQLAPLFDPARMAEQQKMLSEALVAVLDHLEDPPWLEHHLAGLGARHVEYGVTAEMYDQVGAALVTTLAEVAGDRWSTDYATAWLEAFGAIRAMMLAGAREWRKIDGRDGAHS